MDIWEDLRGLAAGREAEETWLKHNSMWGLGQALHVCACVFGEKKKRKNLKKIKKKPLCVLVG